MYPVATSGEKTWATECTTYNNSTGGISCTYVHDAFCGADSGRQNDDAELLAFFGPNEPDIMAPVAAIVQPADGATFAPGETVTVEVSVTDDHEGFGWRLRVVPSGGDEQIVNAYKFETSWNISAPPNGEYTIIVEAIDHDRNEGSAEVTIYVGEGPPPGEGSGGESTGADGTAGSTAGGSAGEGGTAEGSGNADGSGTDSAGANDATDRGCVCGTGRPAPTPAGWMVAGLAGLLGRRRHAARGHR